MAYINCNYVLTQKHTAVAINIHSNSTESLDVSNMKVNVESATGPAGIAAYFESSVEIHALERSTWSNSGALRTGLDPGL